MTAQGDNSGDCVAAKKRKPKEKVVPLDTPLLDAQACALVALGQHRVHTTAQLRDLVCPTLTDRWVRELMNRAAKAGLVKAVRQRRVASSHGSAPNLWILTEKGADAVATHPEFREQAPYVPDAARVLARGERHTLGVNEFGILLTALFRERGYAVSWRNEVMHPLVPRPRIRRNDPRFYADAVLQLDYLGQGQMRTLRLMYEYDRCTEPRDVVQGQMEAILRYSELTAEDGSPFWQGAYPAQPELSTKGFPTVVWNFSGRHEDLREAAFLAELASPASRLGRGRGRMRVLVTTGARLAAEGPLGRGAFFSPYEGVYMNILGQKAREGALGGDAEVRSAAAGEAGSGAELSA